MKRLLLLLIVVGGLILGTDMDLKAQSAAKEEMRVAKAPLFRDPIHDGAADPMVIYNEQEKAWYMFYTNRRANVLRKEPIGVMEPGSAWQSARITERTGIM